MWDMSSLDYPLWEDLDLSVPLKRLLKGVPRRIDLSKVELDEIVVSTLSIRDLEEMDEEGFFREVSVMFQPGVFVSMVDKGESFSGNSRIPYDSPL